MKRILVTGAGGAPALNFVRSLNLAGEPFYFIGVDCDKYYLMRAETQERYLIPKANDPAYLPVLLSIIRQTHAGMIFAQPDVEIEVLSELREQLPLHYFWPAKETIRICMNKYLSFERWKRAGLKVPETIMVRDKGDLLKVFERFGGKVWLRAVKGAFGKGSLPTGDIEQATAWIDYHKGWGSFTAAECLEPQSITWQSIWAKGELVVAQGRKRLYWEFANRTPSGVTGLTGAGVTISDPVLDEVAQKAIFAIDHSPHGIFSVDLTYDSVGVPNPTEINIGRFFTTHLFFSKAGLNMPYIFVKLAFGEEPPSVERRMNPLPSGLVWIRGMDCEPILTEEGELEKYEKELMKRRETTRND